MATDIAICNLALARIGQGVAIASLTEASEAAVQCAALFPVVRDGLLRDWLWPFAVRRVVLALVETDPTADWSYSYRLPVDCLRARELVDQPRDTPWVIEGDDAGGLLLCSVADAALRYTAQITDVNRWPIDVADALAWRLGMELAPVLARDAGRGEFCRQGFTRALDKALANTASEGRDPDPDYTAPGLERT